MIQWPWVAWIAVIVVPGLIGLIVGGKSVFISSAMALLEVVLIVGGIWGAMHLAQRLQRRIATAPGLLCPHCQYPMLEEERLCCCSECGYRAEPDAVKLFWVLVFRVESFDELRPGPDERRYIEGSRTTVSVGRGRWRYWWPVLLVPIVLMISVLVFWGQALATVWVTYSVLGSALGLWVLGVWLRRRLSHRVRSQAGALCPRCGIAMVVRDDRCTCTSCRMDEPMLEVQRYWCKVLGVQKPMQY